MRRSTDAWRSPVPDRPATRWKGREGEGTSLGPLDAPPPASLEEALTPAELSAARHLIVRVLDEVPARLVQAALFGSKARGQARPDSDVDILLVFEALPPGREPHAGIAEGIAHEVAWITGVPVTVWSVSLADLAPGERTPMLVDALGDAIPLWFWPEPLEAVDFTPADALRCGHALLERVREGSHEFAAAFTRGDIGAARLRARDDILRLCTALLLARGVTRPRRAAVVAECRKRGVLGEESPPEAAVLEWVEGSFGADGRNEEGPVPPPPCPDAWLGPVIDALVARVTDELARLEEHLAIPEAQ